MGRIVFVPLLAGVLFLAACSAEEEESASEPSVAEQPSSEATPPAQSNGALPDTATANAESGVEPEVAEAGQQAAADSDGGDSQPSAGASEDEDLAGEAAIAAAPEAEPEAPEVDSSAPPVPTDGERGTESAEIPEGDRAVAQNSVPGEDAGEVDAKAGGKSQDAGDTAQNFDPPDKAASEEPAPADLGTKAEKRGLDWRSLTWMLAIAAVLVALVAVGLLGWVLGRRAARRVTPVAPSTAAGQATVAGVPTAPVPTADGLSELKSELVQAVLTFSKAVDERDAKIKRYEEGYDLAVFKRFLRRFINVDLALRVSLKENPNDETLNNLQEFLDDAFEECGVRRFEPPVGSLYREAWGVQGYPKTLETGDESLHGCIAEVFEPGYEFVANPGQEEKRILVQGAKVRVHKFTGKEGED